MEEIVITSEAALAVQQASPAGAFYGGWDNGDGTWTIELRERTIKKLESIKMRGETLSDLLIRLTKRVN